LEKNQVLTTLQSLRNNSIKRNFSQSVDLLINLKDLNLKVPEENLNIFMQLPHNKTKLGKIAAFVGKELLPQAKENCDFVIPFDKFEDFPKRELKKIAKQVSFFIAQATVMPKVATSFGKLLGPSGKMPNPKAGCVVPHTIPTLKPVVDKLRKTIRIQTKNELAVKCSVGVDSMDDDKLAENILAVYNAIIQVTPKAENNIQTSYLKLTMSGVAEVGKELTKESKEAKKTERKELRELRRIALDERLKKKAALLKELGQTATKEKKSKKKKDDQQDLENLEQTVGQTDEQNENPEEQVTKIKEKKSKKKQDLENLEQNKEKVKKTKKEKKDVAAKS